MRCHVECVAELNVSRLDVASGAGVVDSGRDRESVLESASSETAEEVVELYAGVFEAEISAVAAKVGLRVGGEDTEFGMGDELHEYVSVVDRRVELISLCGVGGDFYLVYVESVVVDSAHEVVADDAFDVSAYAECGASFAVDQEEAGGYGVVEFCVFGGVV